MKKRVCALAAVMLASVTMGALAGCTGKGGDGNSDGSGGTFDYYDEMLSETCEDKTNPDYNSNLFYVNTLDFEVADPTVIYVPEGRDGGGYFYAYGTSDEIGCHGIQGWRSKDLSRWETVGIVFQPDWENTWAVWNYWAPEIIYDETAGEENEGLYYLFYNADNQYDGDRKCISVAVSETPYGPFRSPDQERNADGEMLSQSSPVYDLTPDNDRIPDGLARSDAIDAAPFIDPVTGDKYLYFSYYNDYGEGSFLYGMKMKDWYTPEYETMKMITAPGYMTVEAWETKDPSKTHSEGGVNEGAYMVYHDGKYYMTLSVFGYMDPRYQVIQATSDSPLGTFEKIADDDGGKVISTDTGNWNHIVSAGHHCFITVGDELWIAYHTFKNRNDITGGRSLAVDRVVWMENPDGTDVMYTNGPTWSAQPLPEAISGYKNIAPSATVTANNTDDGSDVALLTDEIIKYQEFDLAEEYYAKPGESVIELSWDDYKTVRAIMIYNAMFYEDAFAAIKRIEMDYLRADGTEATVSIENLPFDWSWNSEIPSGYEFMLPGGAAIAEFYEMPVKSIRITIDSASSEDYLAIPEIVVLGKDTACAGVSEFKEYTYENAPVGSAHIVKDSLNFGSVEGTDLYTWYGYDLSHDDGTENAYIEQTSVTDQYAYFKDIYSTSFYAKADITVPVDVPFYAKEEFPKFGFVVSCDGVNQNTIFYYVDGANDYTKDSVGVAQMKFDNSTWDWDATEQLAQVPGLKYKDGVYVTMEVLRIGSDFYFICNGKVAIHYSSFRSFNDVQEAAVGFLSFNTPMIIKNYSATDDQGVIDEMYEKYAASIAGETFGSVGTHQSTSGWDFTNDRGENATATQSATGDQYAFFKDINATSFYVETEITVTQDLGDEFPKIGLASVTGSNTFFFYIDAVNDFTGQNVGYVSRNEANDGWLWDTESNVTATPSNEIKYSNGEYVKLGLLRVGNTFKMFVNDELVLTVSDVRGFGADDVSAAAVLTFTTGVEIRNYSATTDQSKIDEMNAKA